MKLSEAIAAIENSVDNARDGLPQDVFELVSRLVPMVNVDLLIKDEQNRTLLAWRDDIYAGTGWHIPGGIIRFKEDPLTRLQKVAQAEIGCTLEYDDQPIALTPIICRHETRGHFFSLLYQCYLPSSFQPDNHTRLKTDPGYLAWHSQCPDNLVKCHDMYRDFIKQTASSSIRQQHGFT
jgi:colanic acid biosynthesis protein WcaH